MVLYIVEDEIHVRNSLRDYINWNEIGITKVCTAKNGAHAIELMDSLSPDLLLSDVRMPKMDGIGLATYVRQHYPTCKIVFLSGYADKDYLKSAISLQVIEYIEKPLDISSIMETMKKAVKAYREQKEGAREKERMALGRILQDSVEEQESYQIFDRCHFKKGHECFKVISLDLLDQNKRSEEFYESFYKLLSQESLNEVCHGIFLNKMKATVLICGKNAQHIEETEKECIAQLENWLVCKEKEQALDYVAGIGGIHRGIHGMRPSYEESLLATKENFYGGNNRFYRYKKSQEKELVGMESILEPLQVKKKEANLEELEYLSSTLKDHLLKERNYSIEEIKKIYIKSILYLEQLRENFSALELLERTQTGELREVIEGITNFDQLHQLLEKHIRWTKERMSLLNHYDGRIVEIMDYLDAHYKEKKINVQAVADHFFLSQAYLCAYFKEKTGMTINQYMTKKRIEAAKKMLKESHAKVYEIGLELGFKDTNYFSSLFKRHVGVTPLIYRERKLER